MKNAEHQDPGGVLAPAPHAPVELLHRPPTFSVVIPAYQTADTIGESVRSALAQVHPPHEVIVIDDGSTDDLEGALCPFEAQIKVIRKENGGAASARNAGAAAASGDFMAILDADDAFHPRRIEALAQLACARPDLDLLTTDTRFVVAGKVVGSFGDHNTFALEDQRAAILRCCFVGGWPAVRLSRLRAIGGFDESLRIAYDWDCWLRLILDGSLAGVVTEPYYDYVLHPGSLSASRVTSLWDRVRLLEKAAGNPALSPAERPLLMRSLRGHRTKAVRAETMAALRGDWPSGPRVESGWEHRLGRLAILRGIEVRTRMLVALALIAPSVARRTVPPDLAPEARFTTRNQ